MEALSNHKKEIGKFPRYFVGATFLVIVAIAATYFFEFKEVKTVNYTIFGLSLLFFIYIFAISYFSIQVLNSCTPENFHESENQSQKKCKYCGGSPAGPFLCGNCNSITWYNLKGKNWMLPTVIFFLEHRWTFIATLSGILFLGPVYSLVERKKEIQRELELAKIENTKSLNAILDNLSTVRSKIVNLETYSSEKFDAKEWEELHTSYTNIYWNIVPAFERLLQSTTQNNKCFARAIEETQDNKMSLETLKEKIKGEGLVTYGPAFVINHDSFELSCVSFFIKYMNSVALCEKSPTLENINARKVIAKNLYHRLRISSIMMRSLIDSQWLLEKGHYPSEAADAAFYFKAIFVPTGDLATNIFNLNFYYEVRNLEAFKPLVSLKSSTDPKNK